jgi:hypothetical protein
MEKETLLAAIQTTLTKTKVNQLTLLAAQADFSVQTLIDLTFDPHEKTAFRRLGS